MPLLILLDPRPGVSKDVERARQGKSNVVTFSLPNINYITTTPLPNSNYTATTLLPTYMSTAPICPLHPNLNLISRLEEMSTPFSASSSSRDKLTSTSLQSPTIKTKATIMSPTPQDEPQCIEAHKFTTIPRACKLINQQALRLLEDTSRKQYLLFHPVSASQFTTLDEGRFDGRHIIPKKTRLSYNTATSTLVVKLMASPKHDTAALILSMEIKSKLESFGVPLSAFLPVGAAKRQGKYTAKQPDASFKPSFRGENGWPSLVIESGLSESLVQLRRDAAWWLTNSDEQVRIALVISIQKNDRSIVVEVEFPAYSDPVAGD
ncbi:hypothetical protein V493_01726 [Pseudogymnoascus sp. VKM F-4281 (FW-2241)]|nr:hypothetical protein V493_01726 [Pseudogymnoascus sp. VKM F-4281 (FW-2241)]